MTSLTSYADTAPYARTQATTDLAEIAALLAPHGIGLERWEAGVDLSATTDDAQILAAYADDIAKLSARGGYQSHDVVRITPDFAGKEQARAKFLAEHVHDDDEVRFFVEGAGLFYIHLAGHVHALECTAGDLIVLPAGITHWFDMGAAPHFTAIRLFTTPEGWVARFTGADVASHIPLYAGPVVA